MLTIEEIKTFINEDNASDLKKGARLGQRYYEGRHDILDYRIFYYNDDGNLVEDKYRSNAKISHPFFTILVDQLESYIMSFEESPIRAKEGVQGLQEQLDLYFNNKFWAVIGELITGASCKGFEYLYAYKNKKDRTAFQCADSLGVIEVRANDTDDKCEYVIFWYADRIEKGNKKIKRIQVWDAKQKYYFVQDGDGEIKEDNEEPINPKPHTLYQEGNGQITYEEFGYIPFFRLDNNKQRKSSLFAVKDIIDDYDIHACSLSNNLIDFDTPLHVVKGFEGDKLDELQKNVKTKKIIGVAEDGGVDVKTVDIPYQARLAKLELDEKNIFVFGMGFNPSQIGDGNITNVVIQSRYALLDMKAAKMITQLCALLDDVVGVVLAEINANEGTGYKITDIEYKFSKETITNTTENIANDKIKAETKQIEVNTVLDVAEQIGGEKALKAICDIMEWDFEELKPQLDTMENQQNGLNAAQNALDSVITEETQPTAAESGEVINE